MDFLYQTFYFESWGATIITLDTQDNLNPTRIKGPQIRGEIYPRMYAIIWQVLKEHDLAQFSNLTWDTARALLHTFWG